jgi:Tfp pilus assembly protein PilF
LILWFKQKPIGRRELFEIVPFIILAAGVGLIAVWWEKYHQGTRMLPALPPLERILIASRAVWFYLSKIFWPSDLTFIYPQWKISPADFFAYAWLVLCVLTGALIYFSRQTLGRGVEVAALFFVTTLGPLLGFIMLYTFRYTFVADHYQYLACIGPIALVTAGITTLTRDRKNLRLFANATAFAVVVLLCFMTSRQCATYRDLESLWRTTIARNPGAWMAYNNLGVVQFEKGLVSDAMSQYQKALDLHPDYPEAHYNLGTALLREGQIDDAIRECEAALKILPGEPDAHIVLGNAFMAKEGFDRAIGEYEKALMVRPDDVLAHQNLALALQKNGDSERAAREFEKVRQLEAGQKR